MKKIIVASIAIFMATLHLAAQPATNKHANKQEQRKHHQHEKIKKVGHYLNLSDEQKKQAKTINEDYHKKLATLKSNDKLTMGDYKKQSAALEKEKKDKMQALLTPEQKSKLAEGKQKMEEKAQQRSAQRLEKMKIHLGLSDEQTSKIKQQQESFHAKAKAIRDNDGLNQEQKREQLRSLAKEQKEKVRGLLTKEQIEKMEAKKKEKRGEVK